MVMRNGSLLGAHKVQANYAPPIDFTLAQDFMPALGLMEAGATPAGASRLRWTPPASATGYALMLSGANQSGDIVMWTSSKSAAMMPHLDYLSPAEVKRQIAAGTVLTPSTSECLLPAEVATSVPVGTVMAIGYGPEVHFAEKPTAPKWTAKVRYKTSASIMRGMGGMMGQEPEAHQQPGQPGQPFQPWDRKAARRMRRHHRSMTPLAVLGIWIAIFVGFRMSGANGWTDGRYTAFAESSSDRVRVVSVMGRSDHVSRATTFRGADVTNVMGRTDLDLRDATLAPGASATVQVFSMMGAVMMRVPPTWTVDTGAITAMGGVRDERRSQSSDTPEAGAGPAPRLVLRGVVAMGRLTIR